jgi:hypothetical protein
MSDILEVIMNQKSRNKDRHRYTLEEIFEIAPILYVANELEFYPEILRTLRRLSNLCS